MARGTLSPARALARLRDLPVDDLGFARVDLHRSLRHGVPEAVFCQGKTPEQILIEYPDLNLAQVHAALAYYYDHQGEIEAELAQDEGSDERYERRKAEALARRPSE